MFIRDRLSTEMKRLLPRFFVLLFLLAPAAAMFAEKVADLPTPTAYVNDYAHVLSPEVAQEIEDTSTQVHNLAAAELFVVTIKSLDDGQSLEDFTQALVAKWKIGKAGQDRSALMLLVLNPHGLRIETGYGLEGLFNDAKVGAILDQARPLAAAGNYDQAMLTEERALAQCVAQDRGVTLTPVVHTYHRQTVQQPLTGGQIVLGIGFVLLLIYLVATGRLGWAWLLLSMFTGGGGGGGGRDDDDRGGGGFGGVGGGGSGGGGASRDF